MNFIQANVQGNDNQLFYDLIQQRLVCIFTKSSKALLKAWLHPLILRKYTTAEE
jgi:hypothetical protein